MKVGESAWSQYIYYICIHNYALYITYSTTTSASAFKYSKKECMVGVSSYPKQVYSVKKYLEGAKTSLHVFIEDKTKQKLSAESNTNKLRLIKISWNEIQVLLLP